MLKHEFVVASGPGREDCHWLGYRFDEEHGFTPNDGESWIGQGKTEGHYALMSQRGWMTGLWRTESRVWVTESSGRVYMNPSLELRKEPWQTFRLQATLQGVWGLRDDLVFVWGIRDGEAVTFVYDGKEWRQIDTPGLIGCVRGSRDDLIYAVGMRGLIARWNGHAFKAVHGPTPGNLSDVFVVSDDEMYACGTDGDLLTGSIHGWVRLMHYEGMLHCVAKWHDEVWVGAGEDGLFRLVDEQLELVKPNVHAERFDSRRDLLITTPSLIAETKDGASFKAEFVKTLEALSSNEPPSWR
jgi:hypothetical protein